MRALYLACIGLLLTSCNGSKPCPTCECAAKTTSTTESPESPTLDSSLIESDAGIAPKSVGGKPIEVTQYPLHGRAGFDRVSIFSKPDMESPRLGYLRMGTRIMVGDTKYSTDKCPKGWFALPQGGFVCQGRGALVGTKPRYLKWAPPIPATDELEPYRHGFIRRDWTPLYKRLPKTDEQLWAPPVRELELELDTELPQDAGVEPEAETIAHDPQEVDGGVDYYKYTKRKFRGVRQLMNRGFWVSVAERFRDEETRLYFYKTIKGDYVPGEHVHLIKPPRFHGYEVYGDSPLPAAIVTHRHAAFFKLKNERFQGAGPVERLSSYQVFETTIYRGINYYKIDGNRWLRDTQVEYIPLEQPPEEIKDGQKWIRVDLTKQLLVAYEGAMPIFATLISSGLAGSEETVTPKGKFHITFKHLTDDMAGSVGDDEVYSVDDVPWVQYFHRNVAFHASFWHSSYGRPKSHGCINMSPADARFLFNWTDPPLPEKWHGVATGDSQPTTVVIIEGETPKGK